MKILSAVLLGGLVAVAGGILYDTTFEVQEMEGQLARLNRQIVAEREQIQVLKADWSVLNDIRRVEELAVRYLPEMRPAEPLQFASLDIVPKRGGLKSGDEPQIASLVSMRAPVPAPVPDGEAPGGGIGGLINKMGVE